MDVTMAITWSFEPEGFVRFSVTDPYTMDEWREAASAILSAPLSGRRFSVLVDRRNSEPLTTQAVEEMLRFASQHHQDLAHRRVSILVSDDANFGMGRMTELRASVAVPTMAIRTFRKYEDAIHWLSA
jgi:hypothetical protein